GNDAAPPQSGGNWKSSVHAVAWDDGACLPQRNSEPSLQIRCRITASLRATATCARAMPRARSAGAADQQRMGRLVECGAREFVTAPADPPLHFAARKGRSAPGAGPSYGLPGQPSPGPRKSTNQAILQQKTTDSGRHRHSSVTVELSV